MTIHHRQIFSGGVKTYSTLPSITYDHDWSFFINQRDYHKKCFLENFAKTIVNYTELHNGIFQSIFNEMKKENYTTKHGNCF